MDKRKRIEEHTIVDVLKQYINLKIEYYQLSLAETISLLIGKLTLIIFTAVFSLSLFLLFIWLIYNLLMTWIGISWVVTLIEIAMIILFLGLLWIFKDKLIIRPVANSIISILLDGDDNKEKINKEEDKQ